MNNLKQKIKSLELERSELLLELGQLKYSELRGLTYDTSKEVSISKRLVDVDKELYNVSKKLDKIIKEKEGLKCPSCNNPISSNDKFCQSCGESIVDETKLESPIAQCNYCKSNLYEDNIYCHSCGNKLD